MKGSTALHQQLVKNFILAVGEEFDNVMILPYTNGMFRAWDNPERVIHAGQAGALDLLVLMPNGYLWFDGKTGKASFTKEQAAFGNRLASITGKQCAFKLTSIEQGLQIIRDRLNGKW